MRAKRAEKIEIERSWANNYNLMRAKRAEKKSKNWSVASEASLGQIIYFLSRIGQIIYFQHF